MGKRGKHHGDTEGTESTTEEEPQMNTDERR